LVRIGLGYTSKLDFVFEVMSGLASGEKMRKGFSAFGKYRNDQIFNDKVAVDLEFFLGD